MALILFGTLSGHSSIEKMRQLICRQNGYASESVLPCAVNRSTFGQSFTTLSQRTFVRTVQFEI